jgi:hypothetical protein
MKRETPDTPPSIAARSETEFPPVVAKGPGSHASSREAGGAKYGFYIADLIEPEEFHVFEGLWNKLNEEFELNESSDRVCAEMACVYFVRLQRAIKAGNDDAVTKADTLMRHQLNMLKVTRITREGTTVNVAANATPAEWATSLLEKAKGDKKSGKKDAPTPTRDASGDDEE